MSWTLVDASVAAFKFILKVRSMVGRSCAGIRRYSERCVVKTEAEALYDVLFLSHQRHGGRRHVYQLGRLLRDKQVADVEGEAILIMTLGGLYTGLPSSRKKKVWEKQSLTIHDFGNGPRD